VRVGLLSLGPESFLDSPVHCRVQSDGFISLAMQPSIRVAVVSEERMFREAVAVSLTSYEGLEVTAFSGDRTATAGEDGAGVADVVLIDAAPDPQTALARTWEARERWPEAKLIALGLDREDETVVDFIEAGAQGYVLKGASPDGLVEVIRAVHQGRSFCSPRVVASVLARIAALSGLRTVSLPQSVEPLTLREREVLALLAAGLGNKEVGRHLRITVQTVKNHVHRILEKLQVHRRREAVRIAYDLGLLAEPREIAQLRDQLRDPSREPRALGRKAGGPFDGGETA
jgi:two-component system, NarL family, nitrate/nitrite response regulator NarL